MTKPPSITIATVHLGAGMIIGSNPEWYLLLFAVAAVTLVWIGIVYGKEAEHLKWK